MPALRIVAVFTALVLASPALAATPIYRSVGSQPGVLQDGAGNPLTVTDRAVFTLALIDGIGVGDVIQYDSDGDDAVDSLAFISARRSSTDFTVTSATGGSPVPAGPTSAWQIFRAYATLAAAVNSNTNVGVDLGGSENPAIAALLRDFDAFDGGKDLVAADQRWNVACYDDGAPDDTLVYVQGPWVTDANHPLRIFTPVGAQEVGRSQRHGGTWGTGYRRTHALHIVDRDVWLEGLSIRQERILGGVTDPNYDNRVFMVHTGSQGSDIRISHCFGQQAVTSTFARTFDFFEDLPSGGKSTTVRVWNSIGITDSADPGSAAFLSNGKAATFWFNCTGIATNGASAFYSDDLVAGAPAATVVNGLGYSDGGQAVHIQGLAAKFSISFTAVNDTSINPSTNATEQSSNRLGQTFSFAGADAGDYHLAAEDQGARGFGENLSASSVFPFADDIDGQLRPTTGPWDLGADEFPHPPMVDAGMDEVDAGPAGSKHVTVGCGCSSLDGLAAWGALWALRRRRHQRRAE
jgi:hypothetical protein